MNEKKEVKLAIIGAGTGLVGAWVAGEAKKEGLKVWVYEEQAVVGGNVQSPVILGKAREGGAEFIGPKGSEDVPELSYRDTHKLFEALGVKTDAFPLTMSFHNVVTDEKMVLPPIEKYYDANDKIFKNRTSNSLHLEVKTLWNHFFDLLDLQAIIDESKKIKNPDVSETVNEKHLLPKALLSAKQKSLHPDQVLTLEELAEHFIAKAILPLEQKQRRTFVNDILYPLIAAGWGLHQVSQIKDFCAHYAMHYLATKTDWYDVPEGIHSYFDKMLQVLDKNQIHTNCPVEALVPVKVKEQTKYKLRLKDGKYACDEHGETLIFDDVLITTPAHVTPKLLAEIDDKETQTLAKSLAEVKFFDTTIIHHKDPTYKFNEETAANTIYDPRKGQAFNTMVKYWKDDVRKSWRLPGQPKPTNIFHEAHFKHAIMDKNYYKSEQMMHHAQGKNGIFYGGTMGGTGDSHESGIRATLGSVAQCLVRHGLEIKDYPRFEHFPEIVASVSGQKKESTMHNRYRQFTVTEKIVIHEDHGNVVSNSPTG